MTELELIKKCQDGKLDFFSQLYDSYIDEIYKFVYLKVTNKEVSEDLVSETFFSALQKINTFQVKSGANFRAWLYKIAYNKVINYYKISTRTCEIGDYLELKIEEDFGKNFDDKQRLADIKKFLLLISKRDREVIIYRIWHDLSYKEISEIMDLSVDNCKKIVSRTLQKISANFLTFLFIFIFLF